MNDLNCYSESVSKNLFVGACDFLGDDRKSNLNKNEIDYNFAKNKINNLDNKFVIIVVDNTRFPINGAYYQSSFEILINYDFQINPSKKYYNLTILCKIFILF